MAMPIRLGQLPDESLLDNEDTREEQPDVVREALISAIL